MLGRGGAVYPNFAIVRSLTLSPCPAIVDSSASTFRSGAFAGGGGNSLSSTVRPASFVLSDSAQNRFVDCCCCPRSLFIENARSRSFRT